MFWSTAKIRIGSRRNWHEQRRWMQNTKIQIMMSHYGEQIILMRLMRQLTKEWFMQYSILLREKCYILAMVDVGHFSNSKCLK